jgi:REP element-mobilizing transposase RayT
MARQARLYITIENDCRGGSIPPFSSFHFRHFTIDTNFAILMNMNDFFVRKTNRIRVVELYQKGNGYFVTICVQDRQCIFDDENDEGFSKIVICEWQNIMNFYENVTLDEFILMPNHFHAIIIFDGIPKQKNTQKDVNLGDIISRFKNDTRRNIVKKVEESQSFHRENIMKYNNSGGNGEVTT